MMKKMIGLVLLVATAIIFVGCESQKPELIVSGDYKTNYYLNESFDPTGLIVTYKNGSSEEIITDYEMTGFDSSVVGTSTITVTYLDVQTTFTVNILYGEQTTTELRIYDMPDILQSSARYDIRVEDEPLFVYETRVNHARSFTWVNSTSYTSVASFDFLGRVKVTIDIKDDFEVTEATVHPLAYGVETTVANNHIEFYLEYPANYTIELNDPIAQEQPNGSVIQEAIHLFANPIEEDPITEEEAAVDDSILYIGPGVWKTDAIPLESGMTVYLAGGALVYGQFNAYELSDITIRGRGIISGSIYSREEASERAIPIELQRCDNVLIEGIAFLDPAGWTIHAQQTTNLTIDNIKIITARPNGDGVSIQSCTNVDVRNSFVRTWDDSLVVKNVNDQPTENILFTNNILWTDLAQSMEIGYEANGAYIRDVVFENITVLHNYHKAVMSIHNADQAEIYNIEFRNITIEDAYEVGDIWTETYDNFLIDMTIAYNIDWSTSQYERGTIHDITFENIKVLNEQKIDSDDYDLNIRLNGFDETHGISNVTFKDVDFHGEPLEDTIGINTNAYVSDVSVSSSNEPTGAPVYHYYELNLGDYNVLNKIVVPAKEQEAIEIPDFAVSSVEPPYAGSIITGDFTAQATYGVTVQDWGGLSETDYSQEGYDVSNVLMDNEDTWKGLEWPEDASATSYVALSVMFDDSYTVGSIRLFGETDSNYFFTQNISVYAATKLHSTTGLPVFSKKLNGEDYEFSPSKNNFVDIKLAPGEYIAVQLRFYYDEGVIYANVPFLRYIEFYPASLTYGKTPYASQYEDVYNPEKLTDGDVTTYFESKKGVWPGWIVVDMGESYDVRIINLHLPPLSSWPDRTQTIEIKYSSGLETTIDSDGWQELFDGPIDYLFSYNTGNMVSITLPESIEMRSIILIVTNNSAPGGYGAQFSEISVYE